MNNQQMQNIEQKAKHVFVIADPHFFHWEIVKACHRPFKSLKEMHKVLMQRWNKVVKDNDIVYVLGDYALKHKDKQKLLNLTHMLKGQKILIMGNHDAKKPQYYLDLGFLEAVRKPILYNPHVILMHEPPKLTDVSKDFLYIYGHTHHKKTPLDKVKNCCCVCVEKTKYAPVDLNKLIKGLSHGKRR